MHQPHDPIHPGLRSDAQPSPWRSRGRRPWVGAAALLCFGCARGPQAPLDPALTGHWLGPMGVDTRDAFTLEQRGHLVRGTHDFYSANFGGSTTHSPISGTAELPRVVLRMGEGSSEIIASGVLSADSMTLTFTDSIAGGHGHGPPMPYQRTSPP